MGHKRDRTGIEGFFDDLTEKRGQVVSSRKTKPTTTSIEKQATKVEAKRQQPRRNSSSHQPAKTSVQRSVTPTGRPAGKQAGEGPLKRRATLWLSVELMEAYRERTWEERCHLGELVERALREYQERNWGDTT